eukprot:gb/GECG01006692.1/.p1 GENE.gb/GECG01006692.1/~~gb/GECG01006692.1/.p1  ORF type:complete len:446 (+),score=68.66 gb/GECG01006692.1/:1-1338(+)
MWWCIWTLAPPHDMSVSNACYSIPKCLEQLRISEHYALERRVKGPLQVPTCTIRGLFFHRIIPQFMVQGGDIEHKRGRGGESIYGGKFEDESFALKHDKPGLLSMANAGPGTNGSQFFITLVPCPWLDGKHVVFGQVISGMEFIKELENLETVEADYPKEPPRITDCGELSASVGSSTSKTSRKEAGDRRKAKGNKGDRSDKKRKHSSQSESGSESGSDSSDSSSDTGSDRGSDSDSGSGSSSGSDSSSSSSSSSGTGSDDDSSSDTGSDEEENSEFSPTVKSLPDFGDDKPKWLDRLRDENKRGKAPAYSREQTRKDSKGRIVKGRGLTADSAARHQKHPPRSYGNKRRRQERSRTPPRRRRRSRSSERKRDRGRKSRSAERRKKTMKRGKKEDERSDKERPSRSRSRSLSLGSNGSPQHRNDNADSESAVENDDGIQKWGGAE